MSEMGKYPFTKILIDAVYIYSWVISSLYKTMYLSGTVLNRGVNLLNGIANLVCLCKVT